MQTCPLLYSFLIRQFVRRLIGLIFQGPQGNVWPKLYMYSFHVWGVLSERQHYLSIYLSFYLSIYLSIYKQVDKTDLDIDIDIVIAVLGPFLQFTCFQQIRPPLAHLGGPSNG